MVTRWWIVVAAIGLLLAGGCGGDSAPCAQSCGDRACGPDPTCGTSCGECAASETCNAEGACVLKAAELTVCDGYGGLSSCCFTDDVCGLAGDGQCDCGGACGWDSADCTAGACRADGRCDAACEADPDCLSPCPCDHARGVCEAADACGAAACGCDADCVDATSCEQDDHCDPLCPRGSDPDCAGSPQDGQFCCRPDCEGKVCGDDGCGGSCGTCAAGEGCFEGRCLVDECGNIGFLGCCDNGAPVWCEGGQLVQADCGGDACGWIDAEQGYYCGGEGEAPDADPPLACDFGDCTADCAGKVCGSDGCGGSCGACTGGQVCNADGTACAVDACGDIGFLGCCDGDAPVWCEDGELVQADCEGDPCGWIDEEQGYYCGGSGAAPGGDPPITCAFPDCTPECGARVCGDDGCGGACGTCGADETCDAAGRCVPQTCTPACGAKVCGDDGCGGSCGACGANETCDAAGQCVPGACTPDCAGKDCGDDGCGGSCGTCEILDACAAGTCTTVVGCGNVGALGCCEGDTPIWCEGGELVYADCVADVGPGTPCGWVDSETGYYCEGSGSAPGDTPPIVCDYGL